MGKKKKILTEEEMNGVKNRFSTLLEYSFINKEADLLLDEDDDEKTPIETSQTNNNNEPQINTDTQEVEPTNNAEDNIASQGIESEPEPNNDLEIDVTDLTNTQKSIEDKVGDMTQQNQQILDTIEKLTNSIQNKLKNVDIEMSSVKDEIIKRNPTNKEVLQKRITLSNPFTETPENYWNKKQTDSNYKLSDDDQQKEYELKASDIDSASPFETYKSFGIKDDEWNQSLNNMFK